MRESRVFPASLYSNDLHPLLQLPFLSLTPSSTDLQQIGSPPHLTSPNITSLLTKATQAIMGSSTDEQKAFQAEVDAVNQWWKVS